MTSGDYTNTMLHHLNGLFGDKWSLVVLNTIYSHDNGVSVRFTDIQKELNGCSRKVLSQTLKSLMDNELVNRVAFPEVPPRVEYSLTEDGKDLMPALRAMVDWTSSHVNRMTVVKCGDTTAKEQRSM